MNKYKELKEKHSKEVNEFPMMFAFSNKQFAEGMQKLGLKETDTDKIFSIGAGGFVKKTDSEKLDIMFKQHDAEMKEAVNEDLDGTGFIFDMFKYELNNHEYCYTYDVEDTLNALGYSIEDVRADEKLLKGLELAKAKCRAEDE